MLTFKLCFLFSGLKLKLQVRLTIGIYTWNFERFEGLILSCSITQFFSCALQKTLELKLLACSMYTVH